MARSDSAITVGELRAIVADPHTPQAARERATDALERLSDDEVLRCTLGSRAELVEVYERRLRRLSEDSSVGPAVAELVTQLRASSEENIRLCVIDDNRLAAHFFASQRSSWLLGCVVGQAV